MKKKREIFAEMMAGNTPKAIKCQLQIKETVLQNLPHPDKPDSYQ